jgi:predicted Zn-dependent protease
MPSHIFTRVGVWKDSIASNLASVEAARTTKEFNEEMHGWDYLVYAYLQLGDDAKARAVIDEMTSAKSWDAGIQGPNYANAASPARYAIERDDWVGAATLTVKPSRFNQAMAITHFARALGAARSGKPEDAKADVAKLAELRDTLMTAKDAYWASQVDVQHQVTSAWAAFAEGKRDDALKMMSVAADAEDRTEKAPVTPGPLAPARELYGDMLLEAGMPKEALVQFEATKAKEPNRFHGFAGAAMAADRLGDKTTAKANYEKLVALAGGSGADRPELAAARKFLASN